MTEAGNKIGFFGCHILTVDLLRQLLELDNSVFMQTSPLLTLLHFISVTPSLHVSIPDHETDTQTQTYVNKIKHAMKKNMTTKNQEKGAQERRYNKRTV
jgi:hypothetical protein